MSEILKNIFTNQRVGRIVAVDKTRTNGTTMLICKCDCGITFNTYPAAFRLNKVTRCSNCIANKVKTRKIRLDLTGQVFGKLSVVSVDTSFTGRGSSWLCECSCGKAVSVRQAYLVNGSKTHCGCVEQKYDNRNYKTLSLQDAHEYAGSKGGICLSTKYKNAHIPLHWRCHTGHEWQSKIGTMRARNTWCPTCANEANRRWTKQDAENAAAKNSGHFLSEVFTTRGSKYQWKCNREHVFEMEFDAVLKGRWCPRCKYKTEQKVRDIFEKLTGKQFPSCRPKWLKKIDSNGTLCLDGFCEELKLAFEYDGEQHYMEFDHYNSSLAERQENDKLKDELCRANGITLIRISYSVADRESFITSALIRLGVLSEKI